MIVRPKPGLTDLLFAVRGSILPRILPRLLTITAISCATIILAQTHPGLFRDISVVPFTLVGIALSIFMSFRNNACYDRWWEGRKLWGSLIYTSRSFARLTSTLNQADRDHLLQGMCAFTNGLRERLRQTDELSAVSDWLGHPIPQSLPNPTQAVLHAMGAHCLTLLRDQQIDGFHHNLLQEQLNALAQVQAGCERLATTPVPFSYSLLLHRTAYLFCIALPFALSGALGWLTIAPVLLISYTFFGLDALTDQLESPFSQESNALPLDAMSRTIERDMLSIMGVEPLPPVIMPVDYNLT